VRYEFLGMVGRRLCARTEAVLDKLVAATELRHSLVAVADSQLAVCHTSDVSASESILTCNPDRPESPISLRALLALATVQLQKM
jgi:hypothetical protein